ncbi:MAG TPA: RHS repeat-associated core domain-containing protein [Solirubrobacteraceae bacterium]|nr:RHS repeat-associated core domain-containing protein [Solirubrobacteraceae bacterium]
MNAPDAGYVTPKGDVDTAELQGQRPYNPSTDGLIPHLGGPAITPATTFPAATGESDQYGYDAAGGMSSVSMNATSGTLASLAYTRDADGQVTQTTSVGLPGAGSETEVYDLNNRLTQRGSVGYGYDAAGNVTQTGSSTNAYDSAGELTSGTGVTYSYDQLGERTQSSPVSGSVTSYGYDQAGNMTSVSRPAGGGAGAISDTYAFDGDGLRATQTIGSQTSHLTWDASGGLPLLLGDGEHWYVYGPGGLPVEQVDGQGNVLFMHHDQQGSTRMLTDSGGVVQATMSYDAYGNPTGSTGTATTSLGYDGQFTDQDTGLIYLRARSYEPATGQFLTMDPMESLTRAPYIYAHDNPLNERDSAGLCSINPLSSSSCISDGVEAGVHFAKEHPVASGITLGVIAVGTGGAALAVEGGLAAGALSAASAAAGSGATALDASSCLSGDAGACVGAGLGLASLALSAPELLASRGLIEDASLFRVLAGAGLGLGAYGTVADLVTGDPDLFSFVLGC